MIQFFRQHSTKVVWVIIILFLATMCSGLMLRGFFDGKSTGSSKPSDSVIASAGDIHIERKLYENYYGNNLYTFQVNRPFQKPTPELLEAIQLDALNKSVQFYILSLGAERQKVKVSGSELKQHMFALMTQMGFKSKKELKEKLKENKMSFGDFEDAQRQELILQKFMAQLQSKVTVSDADVDQKYTDVEVSHILIRLTPSRNVSQASQLAKEIKTKIAAGMPFEEAVRVYSEDLNTKQVGGKLGWLGPNVMPALFTMMHATKTGDVSQPFLTQFGYHLIKVGAKRDRLRPLDLNYDREKQVILNQKRQQVIDAFIQTELAGKPFTYSDPYLEGHSYKRDGQFEKARGAYQRAVSLSPNSSIPHYYIAEIYLAENQNALAKEELQKAVIKGELNPNFDIPSVHMLIAYVYSLEKDAANVKTALDKALALSENDYLALQQLKPLLQKLGTQAQRDRFNTYAAAIEAKLSELIKAQQAKQR